MIEKPRRGSYWSSRDLRYTKTQIGEKAASIALENNTERIEALATALNGEITYVGRLAVKVQAESGEKIFGSDGQEILIPKTK